MFACKKAPGMAASNGTRSGTSLFLRLTVLPLYLLLREVSAVTCPAGDTSGLKTSGVVKYCPGFKDAVDRSYCCPSHVMSGDYYCCTKDQRSEYEAQENAQLRRQFLQDYLVLIILGVVGSVVTAAVIITCLCKNLSFCPLYGRATAYPSIQSTQRYRPVEVIPNKPAANEAPPPYEYSFPYNQQRRNDWLCLLENDVNDTRQESLLS